MNTTVDTEISTFNARLAIEGALKLEARRLWNDIISADAEHDTEWTRMMLTEEMSKVARKRITSRSTSVISNMLDDVYDSVVLTAHESVTRNAGKAETMTKRLKDAAIWHIDSI